MLKHVREHWRLAAAVALTTMLALSVWLLGPLREPTNEATAVVLFRPSATTEALEGRLSSGEVERELGIHAAVADGDEFRRTVEETAGLDLGSSRVDIDTTADGLLFIGVAGDASEAAEIANTWASAYVDQVAADREANLETSRTELEETFTGLRDERLEATGPLREMQRQLDATVDPDRRSELIRDIDARADLIEPDVDRIDSELRSIGSDLAAVELAQLNNVNPLTLTRQATESQPASAGIIRSLLAVVAAGIGLGVLAALLRGHFDRQLRSAEQLEEMGLAVLGAIPEADKSGSLDPRRAVEEGHDEETVRQYHLARTALGVRQHPSRRTRPASLTVAVVSAAPGEGRSTVAANLTAALIEAGEQADLINGDNHSRDIHQHLGLKISEGAHQSDEPSVFVYDTSALSVRGGALDIASLTDWTVLVSRRGRALVDVERTVALVERAGGRVLGVVHIDAPLSASDASNTKRNSPDEDRSGSREEMGDLAWMGPKVASGLESHSE